MATMTAAIMAPGPKDMSTGTTLFEASIFDSLVPIVTAIFTIQTIFAIPSVVLKSEVFYDLSGVIMFLEATAMSLYYPYINSYYVRYSGFHDGIDGTKTINTNHLNWRQTVLSLAVAAWAYRLGSFLFSRLAREAGDSRFDMVKTRPVAFFITWMAQATWIAVCMLPVIAVNSVPRLPRDAFCGLPLMPSDVLGISLFVVGFLVEVIADRQKTRWLDERRVKLHDEEFCARGLWSRCRHPNYFGESVLWAGIATFAAGYMLSEPVRGALRLTPSMTVALCYAGPVFVTMLLLTVSVPLNDRKHDSRLGGRKEYRVWKRNTPKFVPRVS
ncbi:hypothetical protein GE09DRAFT_1218661 [Coniochaeta sp. 2T2.1]|nr:hypothetical protein GE09DRAFT_1218661 [Coniochaeta sp. 2T2.1]